MDYNTFKDRSQTALACYNERFATDSIDRLNPAFMSGENNVVESEINAHEGPFFSSSQLQDSLYNFAERSLFEIESAKSADELAQMKEEDRLYYLGGLSEYASYLNGYLSDDEEE